MRLHGLKKENEGVRLGTYILFIDASDSDMMIKHRTSGLRDQWVRYSRLHLPEWSTCEEGLTSMSDVGTT